MLHHLARKAYQVKKDEIKSAFALNSTDETMRNRQEIIQRLHKLFPNRELDFELHPNTNSVTLLGMSGRDEFCLVHSTTGEIAASTLGLVRKCSICGRQEIVIINELADLGQALELGVHPHGCPTVTYKGMR